MNLRHLTQWNSYKFVNITGTWKNYRQIKHILLECGGGGLQSGMGRLCISNVCKPHGSLGSWVGIVRLCMWVKMQEHQRHGTVTVTVRDRTQAWHNGKRPPRGSEDTSLTNEQLHSFQRSNMPQGDFAIRMNWGMNWEIDLWYKSL